MSQKYQYREFLNLLLEMLEQHPTEAYVSGIHKLVRDTNKNIALSQVSLGLKRLEKKGKVNSWHVPTGRRPRKYYVLNKNKNT